MTTSITIGSGFASTTFTGEITSGEIVIVSAGGVASNVTVDAGGRLEVFSSGTADSVTISNSGGEILENAKSKADQTTVLAGGSQTLSAGVTGNTNVTISSGGILDDDYAGAQAPVFNAASGSLIYFDGTTSTTITPSTSGGNTVLTVGLASVKVSGTPGYSPSVAGGHATATITCFARGTQILAGGSESCDRSPAAR